MPNTTEKTKRGPGRPPKEGETATEFIGIKLTPTEAAKLKTLGGTGWIKDRIRKARI